MRRRTDVRIAASIVLAVLLLSSCADSGSAKESSAILSGNGESERSGDMIESEYSVEPIPSSDVSSETAAVSSFRSSKTPSASASIRIYKNRILRNDTDGSLAAEKSSGNVRVDFGVRSGMPLFKRQSYCVFGTDRFYTFVNHLEKLRARTARFSIAVDAKEDSPAAYEAVMQKWMAEPDSIGGMLRRYSVPLWHMAYVTPAIDPTAKVQDPENAHWYEPVYSVWNRAWTACAAYMAKRNMRSYFEVWNEPDQPYWSRFDWEGYIRLYKNTATALRRGDPEAFVGGPAMSNLNHLGEENFRKFLRETDKAGVPLDFLSMHCYNNDPKSTMTEELDRVRKALSTEGEFRTSQIIYTEFNVYTPAMSEWNIPYEKRKDFTLQKSFVVPKALSAIAEFNRRPDVTQVQWAWLLWQNDSFSLIDRNGNRSPLYHALYLYAHMPEVHRHLNRDKTDRARIDEFTRALDKGQRRDFLERIERYLLESPDRDVCLKGAADFMNLSPQYLSKIYKELTGEGFSDRLTRLKIGRAREMLRDTRAKIYEIGQKLGYSSSSAFVYFFKKQTGITPQQYRMTNGQNRNRYEEERK